MLNTTAAKSMRLLGLMTMVMAASGSLAGLIQPFSRMSFLPSGVVDFLNSLGNLLCVTRYCDVAPEDYGTGTEWRELLGFVIIFFLAVSLIGARYTKDQLSALLLFKSAVILSFLIWLVPLMSFFQALQYGYTPLGTFVKQMIPITVYPDLDLNLENDAGLIWHLFASTVFRIVALGFALVSYSSFSKLTQSPVIRHEETEKIAVDQPVNTSTFSFDESIPAGWFPDPDGKPNQRYWNGFSWTEQTKPLVQPMAATTSTGRSYSPSNSSGMNNVSLVSGILGVPLCLFPIFWVLPILAVILSSMVRKRIRLGDSANANVAAWAFGLGIAGIALEVYLFLSIVFTVV